MGIGPARTCGEQIQVPLELSPSSRRLAVQCKQRRPLQLAAQSARDYGIERARCSSRVQRVQRVGKNAIDGGGGARASATLGKEEW